MKEIKDPHVHEEEQKGLHPANEYISCLVEQRLKLIQNGEAPGQYKPELIIKPSIMAYWTLIGIRPSTRIRQRI